MKNENMMVEGVLFGFLDSLSGHPPEAVHDFHQENNEKNQKSEENTLCVNGNEQHLQGRQNLIHFQVGGS